MPSAASEGKKLASSAKEQRETVTDTLQQAEAALEKAALAKQAIQAGEADEKLGEEADKLIDEKLGDKVETAQAVLDTAAALQSGEATAAEAAIDVAATAGASEELVATAEAIQSGEAAAEEVVVDIAAAAAQEQVDAKLDEAEAKVRRTPRRAGAFFNTQILS